MANEEAAIEEGWLSKRGCLYGFAWSRSWCVLQPNALRIFTDEKRWEEKYDIQLNPKSQATSFQRASAPGDAIKHKSEKANGFVLDPDPSAGKTRRLFYFDAESGDDMNRWLQQIALAASTSSCVKKETDTKAAPGKNESQLSSTSAAVLSRGSLVLTTSWRRWSYAVALPPACSQERQAIDEELMQQYRIQASKDLSASGQVDYQDLGLTFRFDRGYLSSADVATPEIPRDLAGDLVMSCGTVVGELLTDYMRYDLIEVDADSATTNDGNTMLEMLQKYEQSRGGATAKKKKATTVKSENIVGIVKRPLGNNSYEVAFGNGDVGTCMPAKKVDQGTFEQNISQYNGNLSQALRALLVAVPGDIVLVSPEGRKRGGRGETGVVCDVLDDGTYVVEKMVQGDLQKVEISQGGVNAILFPALQPDEVIPDWANASAAQHQPKAATLEERSLWKNPSGQNLKTDSWREWKSTNSEMDKDKLVVRLEVKNTGMRSLAQLDFEPTRLAYVACAPGLRVAICEGNTREKYCATVIGVTDDGLVSVRVDNTSDEEIISPEPGNVLNAKRISRKPGDQLLLFHEGRVSNAIVSRWHGDDRGNRHTVEIDGAEVDVDLNDMNHSLVQSTTFKDAVEFEEARAAFCEQIVDTCMFLEDAITGNRLHVEEQLVRINTETWDAKDELEADVIAKMSVDDLQWVSGSTLKKGDRVMVRNREGKIQDVVEDASNASKKKGKAKNRKMYLVDFADGSNPLSFEANEIKKAAHISGVMPSAFKDIDTITSLTPLLLEPNPRRSQGGHAAQPVLLRAGPGTGKTWSTQQLHYLLAKELRSTDRAVRFVPLLLYIQKLARTLRALRKQGLATDLSKSNLVLLYIENEFSGKERDMLKQALDMRMLIILLDGVDEASDIKQEIEDSITRTIVPMGLRLLVTSRPEGIRHRLYARDFVIFNLQPLTSEQQQIAINNQLRGDEYFNHLIAFSDIRKTHDKKYIESAFPNKADRSYLETMKSPNRFLLQDGSGKYDPEKRMKSIDDEPILPRDGEPRSKYLQHYNHIFSQDFLSELDQILDKLPKSATKSDIAAGVDAICSDKDTRSLAVKLCLLVSKWRKKPLPGKPRPSATSLWPDIVANTDELLRAAEQYLSVFQIVAEALLIKVGLSPEQALILGPLKDPVRIHEKAQEDYADRFQDNVVAEANVVDVIRCRIVCNDGAKMKRFVKEMDGFTSDVDGVSYTLELTRCKNKFSKVDPTHFRNILNNVFLRRGTSGIFAEMQLHHEEILNFNDVSHAHDHYDYFRAKLRDAYETGLSEALDFMLEKMMIIFGEICKVPVQLSVLVCAFSSSQGSFPEDVYDLYKLGIRASIESQCKDPESAFLMNELLRMIAVNNHLAKGNTPGSRTFTQQQVSDLLSERPELFNMWEQLRMEGNIPLVKILTDGDGNGEFQFRHLSFQESYFAAALCDGEMPGFWDMGRLVEELNNPWYKNMFYIGRGHLGAALAKVCPIWDFYDYTLTELGYQGLRNLVIGTKTLQMVILPADNLTAGNYNLLPQDLVNHISLNQTSSSDVDPYHYLQRATLIPPKDWYAADDSWGVLRDGPAPISVLYEPRYGQMKNCKISILFPSENVDVTRFDEGSWWLPNLPEYIESEPIQPILDHLSEQDFTQLEKLPASGNDLHALVDARWALVARGDSGSKISKRTRKTRSQDGAASSLPLLISVRSPFRPRYPKPGRVSMFSSKAKRFSNLTAKDFAGRRLSREEHSEDGWGPEHRPWPSADLYGNENVIRLYPRSFFQEAVDAYHIHCEEQTKLVFPDWKGFEEEGGEEEEYDAFEAPRLDTKESKHYAELMGKMEIPVPTNCVDAEDLRRNIYSEEKSFDATIDGEVAWKTVPLNAVKDDYVDDMAQALLDSRAKQDGVNWRANMKKRRAFFRGTRFELSNTFFSNWFFGDDISKLEEEIEQSKKHSPLCRLKAITEGVYDSNEDAYRMIVSPGDHRWRSGEYSAGEFGLYVGSVNPAGRAHGKGELIFFDGKVLVGTFIDGHAKKGLVYHAKTPMFAFSQPDDESKNRDGTRTVFTKIFGADQDFGDDPEWLYPYPTEVPAINHQPRKSAFARRKLSDFDASLSGGVEPMEEENIPDTFAASWPSGLSFKDQIEWLPRWVPFTATTLVKAPPTLEKWGPFEEAWRKHEEEREKLIERLKSKFERMEDQSQRRRDYQEERRQRQRAKIESNNR